MATPRIRVTASPGWEVLTPDAAIRVRALASDPFLARVLGDRRLSLDEVRSARPRRGAPARAGVLTAEIEAPSTSGWVLVARHPSDALTFHPPAAVEGGTHRFEVRLAPPAGGRRGLGAVVRVFFLRLAGTAAGALLPVLARAWETRRFAAAGIPLGLVTLAVRDGRLVAKPARKLSLPPPPGRSLLFIHGTFSHAAAAFNDLAAAPGLFAALEKRYEGRIFAFNHFTVGTSPSSNVRDLLAGLPRTPVLVDAITHSRGGLVLRALAEEDARVALGRVLLVASPNEGTPLASPARWHHLAAWLANLGEMFPGGALAFGLDFAAEALVWMASRTGGALPGIAAMDPAGEYLEELNAVSVRRYEVAAAVARYEPRGTAARRLVDAAAGVFFEDPNDLVVPTEGGTLLGAAPPVPAENIVRFGPGGNAGAGAVVHHLNLFAQKETKEKIKIFLEGSRPYSPDVRSQGRASRAAERSKTLDTEHPGKRLQLSAAASAAAAYQKKHSPPGRARSASSSSAKSSSSSRTPRPARRFELVLVGGKSGTPAHLLASFGGARVVEPFETKGGAAGERMRRIIALHERVLAALDGGGRDPLPAAKELRDYGAVLFETLFPGAVRRLWDEARTAAKGALEIVFTPGLDWIADKPWELAYDASRNRFLADDAVLVRGVFGAPPSVASAPRRGPLHVLVALAEPRDAAPVAARQEAAAIRAALAPLVKAGHARLDVLTSTTPAGLHRRLSAGPVDVLHFVGHGAFDEKEKTGALFLVDARGRSLAVDTDRVLRLLAGRGLKLVVLNACETGRGGRTDFLRGVAPALLAGGVPAVLANQYKVLDSSATAFARHLYWALAKGHSLGAAAREARVAVSYAKGAEPMDWAVPVLYARDTSLVFCRPAKAP
jgi:CHAT domain